ncbi:MAG: regulatory protein RecX [Vicinamibacteraceae bacterium]
MAGHPRQHVDPYVYALIALGRRELTSAQLRDRLARRGHDPLTIERVLVRLQSEGALDDRRAAAALARTAVEVKRHGRWRVQRELDRLGVDREIATDVVEQVFDTVNETELLERALSARLRGPIADRRQFDRLYRYLIRQGFASDHALLALRRHAVDVGDE